VEWITGLFTLLGAAIGAGISEYRNWRERKNRLRIMTFEKRLEAHQKAYYWCHKLNEVLNISNKSEIHRISNEAREWWNNNSLYLDAVSRSKMVGLFNLAHMYADDHESGNYVWERLWETFKAIVSGIGFEYLPEEASQPDELKKVM
jgi:TPR repeat protein